MLVTQIAYQLLKLKAMGGSLITFANNRVELVKYASDKMIGADNNQ